MTLPSFSSFFRPAPLAKTLGAGVGALALLGLGGLPSQAATLLTFEGLADQDPILNFYPGVTFADNALASISFNNGGTGDFIGEPSPITTMVWFQGNATAATVSGGFDQFSTYYSSITAPGTLSFFDGPDGTGAQVGSLSLPPLGQNCDPGSGYAYNCWSQVSVDLPSSASSVVFGGSANEILFDNVSYNLRGPSSVPGPLPLFGAATALGFSRRLRQRVRNASPAKRG